VRRLGRGLALLFVSATSFAQPRVEPLTPRLSPAPAVSVALPSYSAALMAPSLAAPAPLLALAPSVVAAPALSAVPAAPALMAAAVPAAAAAPADGPKRLTSGALPSVSKAAAPNDDAELPSRSLNVFWDGLGTPASVDEPLFALPSAVVPEAAGSASAKPASAAPWLALEDRRFAAALDAAVKLARGTRAGRKAFAAAEQALDGASLPVDVLDLGRNWGEFDYLDGRLRLDRKLFAPGREADLAGTIAHELMHVSQHAQGLPSNALELEIEAHLLDLALMEELGLTPPPNTFALQAREALAKSPKAFIELIQAAVPGSPFLGESSFEDIVEQLEEDLAGLSRKKNARAVKLAAVVAQDLKTLRSKKGRAAYKEFSKRVLTELARRSAAAR
jgi:hypothetical protein